MKRIFVLLAACVLLIGSAYADISAYQLALEMNEAVSSMAEIREMPLDDALNRVIWTDSREEKDCELIVHMDADEAAEAAVANGTRYTMVRAVDVCTIGVSSGLPVEVMEEYERVLADILGVELHSDAPDYILNVNTKKFHDPHCSSVEDMKETNRQPYTGDRDEVIEQGYVPCKRCNP